MTRIRYHWNWHPTTAKRQPTQLWFAYSLNGTYYIRFGSFK